MKRLRGYQAVCQHGSLQRLIRTKLNRNDAAKVGSFEFWVEQREHVVVHGSSGSRVPAKALRHRSDELGQT